MHSATISIREALFPSLVMEGAIKPMMISGTQKLINWPTINFTVTIMFRSAFAMAVPSAAESKSPAAMPAASARSRRNGRLFINPSFSITLNPFSIRIRNLHQPC